MTTLECKQCGYVNEGERVYCHNCGARLDRSLLVSESKPLPAKKPKKKRPAGERVAAGFWAPAWAVLKLVLAGAALAAVAQGVREPEGRPVGVQSGRAPAMVPFLKAMVASPMPRRMVLEEDQINEYLHGILGGTSKGMLADYLRFEGAYVNLGEGVCKFTLQQSLFGWSLYFGGAYRIESKSGKTEAVCVGGNVGRLNLSPGVMKYCGFVLKKLWAALDQERQLLGQLKSIETHPKRAILISKGALQR